MTPFDSSLRQRLRLATQKTHDHLDSDALSLVIVSPEVTRDDYARFLKRTYGFVAPLEASLFASPAREAAQQLFPAWQPRVSQLVEDLTHFDINPQELPLMAAPEGYATLGELMGAIYVLEGSAMGGLVMGKQLSRFLGLTPETGLRYFLPYEPKLVVGTFHQFIAALDSFARCQCDENEALDGAVRTFSAIDRWFALTAN